MDNKRTTLKIKTDQTENLLQFLMEKIGVPEVGRQMAIYISSDGDDNKEVHIKIKGLNCFVKTGIIKNQKKSPNEIELKRGLKSVLRFLKENGYGYGTIGEVFTLGYREEGEMIAEVLFGSFIGDIVEIYENKSYPDLQGLIMDAKFASTINESELPEIIEKLSLEKFEIIDELGVLNSQIDRFCLSTGFDVNNYGRTLNDHIEAFSNDFSYIESLFEKSTDMPLLSKEASTKSTLYKPVSIVIPSYNSESTLLKTIASIQSQDLPEELLRQTEIVVIDDGSHNSIEALIDGYEGNIITSLKVVRLVNNGGLSTARNVGVNVARHETIVFLDSDVLLSKNYLLEVSLRNRFVPNAVFVSFKENIEPDHEYTDFKRIKSGLPKPDISRDMRIMKHIDVSTKGVRQTDSEKYIEILSESDYFKKFGFGRKIGIFDLPSMVVGHNMSLRKKTYFSVGGFSKEFIGWGMEDSYFGARLLANKNFVIPIINCGVYHIDHPPRSGSEEKKKQEFEYNLDRYLYLLHRPMSD